MSDDKLMSDEELEAISKLAYGGGKGDPQRDVRRLLMHVDAMNAARATAPSDAQDSQCVDTCNFFVKGRSCECNHAASAPKEKT